MAHDEILLVKSPKEFHVCETVQMLLFLIQNALNPLVHIRIFHFKTVVKGQGTSHVT